MDKVLFDSSSAIWWGPDSTRGCNNFWANACPPAMQLFVKILWPLVCFIRDGLQHLQRITNQKQFYQQSVYDTTYFRDHRTAVAASIVVVMWLHRHTGLTLTPRPLTSDPGWPAVLLRYAVILECRKSIHSALLLTTTALWKQQLCEQFHRIGITIIINNCNTHTHSQTHSCISWAVCKSASRSRQTATPAPHHWGTHCSIFG